MKKIILSLCLMILLGMVSACAENQGQYVYNADQVGKQSDLEFGKIIAVRQVKIQEKNSGVGTLAGVTAGGAAGSNFGGGNGNIASLIGGAIIGGIAGSAAEKAFNDHIGVEYRIRKDNRKIVSIVQNIAKDEAPLAVGQRVMIQTSGEYQKIADKKQNEQYQRVLPVENDEEKRAGN